MSSVYYPQDSRQLTAFEYHEVSKFPYDLFRSNYEVFFIMKGFQFKFQRVRYYFTGKKDFLQH